jgi:hypothetical protein
LGIILFVIAELHWGNLTHIRPGTSGEDKKIQRKSREKARGTTGPKCIPFVTEGN